MYRNKIAFIILLIPAFLFLQGCQDNIILPDTVNQLQAPRLLYPANNAKDINLPLTVIWQASESAISYQLQISKDSNFNNIVYDLNRITSTNYRVNNLENSTTYYWRVSSINIHGISRWSSICNFTSNFSCPGLPTVIYAGKTYNTVHIGHQCWLKENLDIGIMIQGIDTAKDNGIIEKYCYKNDSTNCDIYGGLYQWNEAMQYSAVERAQGICPPGWHIPTSSDFQNLVVTVENDGNALKALGQGNYYGFGTNLSGFSALLSGERFIDGYFFSMGYYTSFWSSTERTSTSGYFFQLTFHNRQIILDGDYKDYGFSIRCIKD